MIEGIRRKLTKEIQKGRGKHTSIGAAIGFFGFIAIGLIALAIDAPSGFPTGAFFLPGSLIGALLGAVIAARVYPKRPPY